MFFFWILLIISIFGIIASNSFRRGFGGYSFFRGRGVPPPSPSHRPFMGDVFMDRPGSHNRHGGPGRRPGGPGTRW